MLCFNGLFESTESWPEKHWNTYENTSDFLLISFMPTIDVGQSAVITIDNVIKWPDVLESEK